MHRFPRIAACVFASMLIPSALLFAQGGPVSLASSRADLASLRAVDQRVDQMLRAGDLRVREIVAVSGGPSWISVDQDVVNDITVTQTYPYDSATFAGAVTQTVSKTHAGFNAGVNALWTLTPHAALDFGARYAHASVPLTSTATTDAGGAHVTAGLRLRF